MGRRRDKLQGSRRRQVLQLEDDGRDSFLTQYGYNSRYEEEEEDANEVPMFKQHGHIYEENMDFDSDERNPDTEDDGRSAIDFKTNGGGHSEGPQEGKKIDSELANFMAEIEAISNVAPPSDDHGEDRPEGVEKKDPDKESTPELQIGAEGKPADSDVVYVEEPVTCWQQCLDENTECYYYWRVDTNEVTWEIPPEYTQYLLQFKAFEEKVLALEQAGKTVKVTGPGASLESGSAGTEHTGDTCEREPQVYGPFLPEISSEDTNKAGDGENKGSNSAVSVIQGSGKLLSADYYDSDDASEDEADKSEQQPTETVEPEDEDLDFDIDDIDRELELALERKQAEIKASSRSSTTDKSEESAKTTNSSADDAAAIPLSSSQDASAESKPEDSITAPDKAVQETVTPMVVQDSADNVSKPSEDLNDAGRLSTNSSNLLTEFKADSEEKDRNFKKLIEVKDDRASLERRERKLEERHERKSSREERRSSKEDKRSERKSDRKEDRKSEHKEKKKKDDRKEEKKSHRHKHSKGESSSREKSKHGSDYKRSLSDQEDVDSDEHRSHRKRSKHKHREKDKDRTLTSVIKAEPRPASPTDVLPPKPDTTAAPVKDEDKTIKETIVEISETVFGKLQFLEIVKEGLSGLQMLLISLETRIQDWEAGGLSNQYLLEKLQDASDQLLKYEDSAAPPGWSTHWDRNYRRYFYTNVVNGDSQWDYPDPETETTITTDARVPRDGEAAVSSIPTDKGIKERTDGSKQDSDKLMKHTADKVESKLEELQPLVHPGEPPPPGTETPGAADLGQASMDEGSYEVSPAHSIDLEEMDDAKEGEDKSPCEPKDAAVISRPPLLLGMESGDPTHVNHASAGVAALHPEEVPNSMSSQLEAHVPASNSMPEVAPSAESDRVAPDPSTSTSHHKEKKKKKDKSISSSSLSLKKKKVSSLVQKWQQVQQEVEREEKSSKERESYLSRYSP